MRKRAIAASIVSSSVVVLVGWQIGTHTQAAESSATLAIPAPTPSSRASASPSATPAPLATPAPPATSTTAPAPSPNAPATTNTFTGSVASTRYGNVQVQITVSGGKISDVTALQLTNDDSRSAQISNRAAPILRQEVLAAQSANVDSVSGATYTSDGYLKSLQSALDQAGL
ncbi:MAG: FMN-binding protein [Subtercola sp.]|jgi:uncharacterized protein with FMN-binding domain|nr:FMN-binding protein [Subtercola sp.]